MSFFSLQLDCHDDAVVHYMEQLTLAGKHCTNTDYIKENVDALDRCTLQPVSFSNVTNTFTSCHSSAANMLTQLDLPRPTAP